MWSIKPVPQSSEDSGGELALCDICGITLASVVSVENNGVKSKVQRKTILNEDGSVHFTNLSTNEKQCIADVNWRTKYGAMPVVNVPLVLFADDSSGNKTLKWNKFESWLILLAGLPRETNSQLDNIHFVCTSNRLMQCKGNGAPPGTRPAHLGDRGSGGIRCFSPTASDRFLSSFVHSC